MQRSLAVVVVLLFVATSGCSSSGVVAVSGHVTLDAKPLAGAHVSFQPLNKGGNPDPGSGSYAVTSADGSFTLKLVQGDRPGAAIGTHRVEIVMKNESDDDRDRHGQAPPRSVNIPAKYNLASELTCDVPPGGRSDANFDLKSR